MRNVSKRYIIRASAYNTNFLTNLFHFYYTWYTGEQILRCDKQLFISNYYDNKVFPTYKYKHIYTYKQVIFSVSQTMYVIISLNLVD